MSNDPTPIRLDKFQYSSSKRKTLNGGQGCMREYYHKYVAKTYPFVQSPQMLIGTYIDDVLERCLAEGVDPDLEAVRKEIVHIMPDYEFVDGLVEGVDAAYEYAVTRTGLNVLQRRLAVNKRVEPTAVNWRKGSPLFDSAMFDLVTIPSDEEVYVDDWKTGNPGYPDWPQLEDYSLYVFRYLPKVERVIASIVWLRKGRHAEEIVHKSTKVIERKHMRPIVQRWADAHELVTLANNRGVWPITPHKMCSGCPHYETCLKEREIEGVEDEF